MFAAALALLAVATLPDAALGTTVLANLTKDVQTMRDNAQILEASYCPACNENPGRVWDLSTIGGFAFVVLVGVTVGTDVTVDNFKSVISLGKKPFFVGLFCQFVCMPLYAFLLTLVFQDDMTSTAKHSYEASVLGIMIVGCLPGGTTSNLFTWFVGGNVPLSILMSLVSNALALGSMPLLLYLFYEVRFDGIENKPVIPYLDIVIPLILMILGVGIGMLVRDRGSIDGIWWTAKISSIFAILFLIVAVVIGLIKYPYLFADGFSFWIVCVTMQPAGYLFGWLIGSMTGCSLRNKMTIAFETGVQSFTLGMVVPMLSFNSEKEACQFAGACMSLIAGDNNLDRYFFSWDAAGRLREGSGVGKVSLKGFLPGEAGDRTVGGCCRYNEMVFLDTFKYPALCSLLYALHALWMIVFFRRVFPNGRRRFAQSLEATTYPDGCRQDVITQADQECPIMYSFTGVASAEGSPPTTLIDLLATAASKVPRELAICVEPLEGPCPKDGKMEATKSKPISQWTRWTWTEYKADVEKAARAFIHLGVECHGSVAIFGFNSPQWIISAVGAIFAGGKACGIYPTDTLEQVAYKTLHSGSAVAVVEDTKKMERYREKLDELPDLKAIVVWSESPEQSSLTRPKDKDLPDVNVYAWQACLSLGAQSADNFQQLDKELRSRQSGIRPGHACCLVYTSGTTGMPKAVMLSHDNVVASVSGMMLPMKYCIGVEFGQERSISYLPLSHIAGFALDIVLPMFVTAMRKGFWSVYCARPYDLKEGTLKNRLTFVRPSVFLGVPRVWEKFQEGLLAVSRKTAQLKGCRGQMPIFCCVRKTTAATWAKRHGLASQRELQVGYSKKTTCLYGLADALILSQIKNAIGLDNCKLCATGAAPISTDTLEYFGSLGIPINEIFGMSESSGSGTFSTDECHLWGSCGPPAPGTEVKIFKTGTTEGKGRQECPLAQDVFNPTEDEQGEICIRGRCVMMGYLANPKMGPEHVKEISTTTRKVIDSDGWLHTGDKGCLGINGMLKITGRFKELIITAGGENVAPVPIEDCIKALCPAISNVMMVGDQRKFNVCLVTLKAEGATGELAGTEELAGNAKLVVPGVSTTTAAKDSQKFRSVIESAIKAANNNSAVCPSNASRIQKFEILTSDFSVEGGEFTPTLKLKRKFTEEKYMSIIDGMYA
eukprot:TRINITY_DN29195_c0_g1_i1.p1 TRINITY_DN29195_c0_g1~~TRINITY_DN29195_c0_g1_i1.p1  ORF type:complete len:1198 (-),score=177.89 TRINITY_DN29195_c0_g1_i1:176-3691(-)